MAGTPHYQDATVTLWHGDCLTVLRDLPDNTVDSVCTDPPYSLSFMSSKWDTHPTPAAFQAWCQEWATECLRVLRPGGHLVAFGGTRTGHRLTCAIEDAGFEIRDSIAWIYGSGFPKSLDVGKAIDKAAGATGTYGEPKTAAHAGWIERGRMRGNDGENGWQRPWMTDEVSVDNAARKYVPATDAARQWDGHGTSLKPAHEPVTVARKPLQGNVAQNVLTWGTGALNINAGRIGSDEKIAAHHGTQNPRTAMGDGWHDGYTPGDAGKIIHTSGRWPANVAFDGHTATTLDQQSGESVSGGGVKDGSLNGFMEGRASRRSSGQTYESSTGGASRFFFVSRDDPHPAPPFIYTAKANSNERPRVPGNGEGWVTGLGGKVRQCNVCGTRAIASGATELSCGHTDHRWVDNPRTEHTSHPTVKPLDLMRWLARIFTPPTVPTLICSVCGQDVFGMRHPVPAIPERTDTLRDSVQAETGREGTQETTGTLSDMRRDPIGGATTEVLHAGVLRKVTGETAHLHHLPERVPSEPPDADDLLASLRIESSDAAAEALRTVRRDVPTPVEQEPILLTELRGQGSGPSEAQGSLPEREGIHRGLRANAPNGDANGLHPPAPEGSSGDDGPDAGLRRGSASPQRDQGRQPPGEPRGSAEGDARPNPEATPQADHLSSLRGEDRSLGSCSSCGGALTRVNRPGVILEPFAGSGTTVEAAILEGFHCIAIEKEADYLPLVELRIARQRDPVRAIELSGEDPGLFGTLDFGKGA